MNTFFILIIFVAFFVTIYFAVRWVLDLVRKRPGQRGRRALIALAVMVVAVIGATVTTPSTDLTPAQARTKLHQAQATHKTLAAQAATAKARQAKLREQKTLLLAQVAKAKKAEEAAKQRQQAAASQSSSQAAALAASSKRASSQAASVSHAQAVAASQASSQAAAASARAASQASQASRAQASRQTTQARAHTAPTNNGDMNTSQTGKIVGNVNSKIYHVPGQAGYRMNSANAVYFNTEAEAQAAGYRKSLR